MTAQHHPQAAEPQREAFEAWVCGAYPVATSTGHGPERWPDGARDYVLSDIMLAWEAWQAARAGPGVAQEGAAMAATDPAHLVALARGHWNSTADSFNQWDELSEDERLEAVAAYAAAPPVVRADAPEALK